MLAVKVVTEVVASVDAPVTDKAAIEVVASVDVPVTVRAEAEADPKDEVAVAVMEVNEGLADILIWVDVPIKTFCPPLMLKFVPTVKEARVLVPVPPFNTGRTPLTLAVKSMEPANMALVTLPNPMAVTPVEPMVTSPVTGLLTHAEPEPISRLPAVAVVTPKDAPLILPTTVAPWVPVTSPAKLPVKEAAEPVTEPEMGLVTVRLANVPTLVREELVMVEPKVEPERTVVPFNCKAVTALRLVAARVPVEGL